jgi:hypothetical protein
MKLKIFSMISGLALFLSNSYGACVLETSFVIDTYSGQIGATTLSYSCDGSPSTKIAKPSEETMSAYVSKGISTVLDKEQERLVNCSYQTTSFALKNKAIETTLCFFH